MCCSWPESWGRRWYILCLYHWCWEGCKLCELETQAPFPSGIVQDSATEVISITTTLPGLIRHLGLMMVAPCTLLTPGPWAGRGICEWSYHPNTLSLLWPLHDHNVAILHNTTYYYISQYFEILQNTTLIRRNTTHSQYISIQCYSILSQYYMNTTFEYYTILRITTFLNTTKYYKILH